FTVLREPCGALGRGARGPPAPPAPSWRRPPPRGAARPLVAPPAPSWRRPPPEAERCGGLVGRRNGVSFPPRDASTRRGRPPLRRSPSRGGPRAVRRSRPAEPSGGEARRTGEAAGTPLFPWSTPRRRG